MSPSFDQNLGPQIIRTKSKEESAEVWCHPPISASPVVPLPATAIPTSTVPNLAVLPLFELEPSLKLDPLNDVAATRSSSGTKRRLCQGQPSSN